MIKDLIKQAAEKIKNAQYCIAFTGAGISVESGIPPFRGKNSIWSKYDPVILDLNYFLQNPEKSWPVIIEIFYDFFGKAKPNKAHEALAFMETNDMLKCVITQNIDNLHQEAGSKEIYEFHGNSHRLVCMKCQKYQKVEDADLSVTPVLCDDCKGLMKPDFIFFGEQIPPTAYEKSLEAAQKADVCIIVGCTGEVMPAAMIPVEASRNNAVIIEINPSESLFTRDITKIHLKDKATKVFSELMTHL